MHETQTQETSLQALQNKLIDLREELTHNADNAQAHEETLIKIADVEREIDKEQKRMKIQKEVCNG